MIDFEAILKELEEVSDQVHIKRLIRNLAHDSSPNDYEQVVLKLAKALTNKGDYQKAIWVLEESYEESQSLLIADRLSYCYYQLSDYTTSLKWSDISLSQGYSYQPVHQRALILIQLKEYTQAEKLLLELVKLDELNHQAYLTLGNLYFSLNCYDEALTYLNVVYTYLSDQVTTDQLSQVRLMMVEAKLNSEFVDLTEIDELLNQEPSLTSELEYYYLALVNFYLEKHDKAQESAQKAIELNKDHFPSYFILLEIANIKNDYNKVKELIEKLSKNLPPYSSEFIDLYQIAKENEINSDQLADKLEEILSLIEDRDDLYGVISYIASTKSKTSPQKSLDFLQSQINSIEDEYALSFQLAYTNQALGNFHEADDYYQIALDYLIESDKTLPAYLIYLFQRKDYESAEDLYNNYKQEFDDLAQVDPELADIILKIRTEEE